jgi:hypothetical protein
MAGERNSPPRRREAPRTPRGRMLFQSEQAPSWAERAHRRGAEGRGGRREEDVVQGKQAPSWPERQRRPWRGFGLHPRRIRRIAVTESRPGAGSACGGASHDRAWPGNPARMELSVRSATPRGCS